MVFHDISYGQEVPIETMEEECSSSSREVSSPSSSYEDEAESDGDDEYEAESGGHSFEEFDGTGGEETMIVEPYQYKPLLLPQSGESGQPANVPIDTEADKAERLHSTNWLILLYVKNKINYYNNYNIAKIYYKINFHVSGAIAVIAK